MKTPREILFERHRQAEPRLDKVRQQALASVEALRQGRREGVLNSSVNNVESGILKKIWLELIWPSRRAWAGIAVLWLVLLAANLGLKATATSAPAARSVHRGELVQAFEERRRLLAELLAPAKPQPPEPPRPGPRPRSQRIAPFKNC